MSLTVTLEVGLLTRLAGGAFEFGGVQKRTATEGAGQKQSRDEFPKLLLHELDFVRFRAGG